MSVHEIRTNLMAPKLKQCIEPGCEHVGRRKRGMCYRHYSSWRRKNGSTPCSRCDKPMHAKGLCINHYMQSKALHKAEGYNERRKNQVRLCDECKTEFLCRPGDRNRFCSLSHAAQWKARNNPWKKPRPLVLYEGRKGRQPKPNFNPVPITNRKFKSAQCLVCASWFVTLYTDRTCSERCQTEHDRNQKRLAKDRRRARQRESYVADVHRKRVYEIDNYRCHLCNRKVDPSKKVPHPRAATIDHVIPLSKGGTHEPSNCRTACFMCNCLKSDQGGGEQLALIG